jgi:hypothetical protein
MILGKPTTGPLLRAMASTPGIRISAMATSTTTLRTSAAATLEPLDQSLNLLTFCEHR